MTGVRHVQFWCLVLCTAVLSLSPTASAVEDDPNRVHNDAEIKADLVDWVNRMAEQHEASAALTTQGVGVNLATSDEVTITVDIKGKGDYKSVKKAVKAIPDGSSTRFIILVKPGVYKEKVKIPKEKGPITLLGSGNTVTTITYDDTNEDAGGTLKSSSVTVLSDNFIAKDIAFENSSPSPAPGAVGQQAVAFTIAGDKAAFYRVVFLGYQDTLYDRYGRHYFKDCYIRGSIDFIFGDGQSYYETSYLDSVATTFGSLSAQKRTTAKEDSGYVFANSIVSGTKGYIYLGRAWGPYSRVIFINTYLPESIRPEGWFDWGVPGRSKTVFYGEYKNYGPGSNRQGRESWSFELTDKQVKPFLTADSWIQGSQWIPQGPQ